MKKRQYAMLSLAALLYASMVSAQETPKAKEKEAPKAATITVAPEPFQGRLFLGGESYLGVYLEEVTTERVKELNLREERGAMVMKVAEGSPAEKAGLKENDVIVSFNGRRVDTVRELQRLLAETPAGRSVTFEIVRGGNNQSLTATLSKRAALTAWNLDNEEALRRYEKDFQRLDEEMKLNQEQQGHMRKRAEEAQKRAQELQGKMQVTPFPDGEFKFDLKGFNGFAFSGSRLGVTVESLTDQLASYFGVKEGKGVLVTEVLDKSAAERAGIKAGDVILEVDNQKIGGTGDLINSLSKKEEGDVTVKIVRDHQEQTLTVKLEKRQTRLITPQRRRAMYFSQLTDAV